MSITTVMDSLTIQSKVVGPVKNPNCKSTFVQVVKLLILFPFFSVKNAADYANSGPGKLFSCKKDMFYRLMDDGRIDWRRLIYSINWQIIGKISRRADTKEAVRCLIIDDTDLPKRGMKAESLGRVFSHTAMKSILGCVKRFEAYETIGGLFAEVTGETVELSAAQRIWGLILEVINVIAGFIACDPFDLIENVINNNQIKAVKQAFDRLDLVGAAA